LLAGIGAGAMNIGFIYSDHVVQLALQDGVVPQRASMLGWIPVLIGGVIPQLIYPLYLMIKNGTYRDYKKAPAIAYAKALLTSLIWFCALTFYAKGTVMLGGFGAAIGWVAFSAIALVVSNYLAIRVGEWDGYSASRKLLIRGNLLLIIAFVLVGISNCM
ncbi:MAG: L-rhamnose/proton symporter RhaT, partial [Cellulosilyticaceae bacterium]